MTNTEQRAFNRLLSRIRQKCMDCSGGLKTNVDSCPLVPVYEKRSLVMGCPLWEYRTGELTDKDKRKLQKARKAYEATRQAT